jgi:hypothetical protein
VLTDHLRKLEKSQISKRRFPQRRPSFSLRTQHKFTYGGAFARRVGQGQEAKASNSSC